MSVEVISAQEFASRLKSICEGNGPPHVIGVDKKRVLKILLDPFLGHTDETSSRLPAHATITFYDDDDQDDENRSAYCLGELREGLLTVTHKTYETMTQEMLF